MSCKCYKLFISSFTLQEGQIINDVIRDVLMQDPTASSLIGGGNLSLIKVNVFRFKLSLDDPTLLFWRPCEIIEGEWPYIFFLKLEEGKLLLNKNLGASV